MDDYLLDMDFEQDINEAQPDVVQLDRVFKNRINPFEEWSDRFFVSRVRFSKAEVLRLTAEIREHLTVPNRTSLDLPPELQVITALHYFASGT